MKKKLRNKTLFLTAAILIMAFGWNMMICAKPATMPDGTVFDAEFYAQTYPDVAAVYGNDVALLYQHYVLYGKAEGRIASAPEILQETPSVPEPPVAVQQLTNAYRQAGGLSGLSWDDTLAQAASLRATEIYVLFSHTRPNGASCFSALPSSADIPWPSPTASSFFLQLSHVRGKYSRRIPFSRTCNGRLDEQ